MKIFKVLLFALAFPFLTSAQINKVHLQAAGLTCSMCSNAINKSLRSLSYVQDVATDLETNTFSISFKNSNQTSFDELKKMVEKAGFSVTKMVVEMDVKDLPVANEAHIIIGGKQFHFVKVKAQKLNGNQAFTLVDKGFLPLKSYKIYAAATQMDCIKTGVMEACCKGEKGTRIYHVTI